MDSSFDHILETRPDPLDVLKTTAYVVEHARSVTINPDAIERAADALAQKQVEPPAWNYAYHYYDGTPRTVNYLFLLDALNFCFWGDPRWKIEYEGKILDGYWALAAALKRAIEQKPETADAAFLAHISLQQLEEILHGTGDIPLFTERWRNVRELGVTVQNLWEGEAARLVEYANHDAARLAQMIAETFASFNDIAVYEIREGERGGERERGRGGERETVKHEVRFFKRAQILVTDLWGAFRGKDWGEFENINVLTAFADYKLPQILRAWGVLNYAPALAQKVDDEIQLEAGSAEEIEIRAATLWAVEFLREALAARGRNLWSIQVDWILWDASQGKFPGMKPYHRVRTDYY